MDSKEKGFVGAIAVSDCLRQEAEENAASNAVILVRTNFHIKFKKEKKELLALVQGTINQTLKEFSLNLKLVHHL